MIIDSGIFFSEEARIGERLYIEREGGVREGNAVKASCKKRKNLEGMGKEITS